jgi:hypothetical protein
MRILDARQGGIVNYGDYGNHEGIGPSNHGWQSGPK